MSILVAIPLKKSLSQGLRDRLDANIQRLNYEVAVYENEPQEMPKKGSGEYVLVRSRNLARARNELLDKHLSPHHEYVMWIDADIVDFPSDLPDRLLEVSKTDIVAPLLLIEDTNRYYDTFTHVEMGGRPASPFPPYFYSKADPVLMDCVGGCYLAPAEIYHAYRYEPWNGHGMEHMLLMDAAKRQGYRIFVTRQTVVYHANLPNYGEAYH